MSAEDRDRQFERALAHHLIHASGSAGCPDAETLAAYHERALSPDEVAHWGPHIVACPRCAESLALLRETDAELVAEQAGATSRIATPGITISAAAPAKLSRGMAWRWAVPVGVLAAGLLIWVSLRETNRQPASDVQVAQNHEAASPQAPNEGGTRQQQLRLEKKEKEPADEVSALPPAKPSSSALEDMAAPAAPAPQANVDSITAGQAAPAPASGTAAADFSTQKKDAPVLGYSGAQKAAHHSRAATSAAVAMNRTSALTETAVSEHLVPTPDEGHMWRIGPAGRIERTNDGGKTWDAQSSGASEDLTSGSAPSDQVCWVAGNTGTLLFTQDGGKHWKRVTVPFAEDLGGVRASDAAHALIWDVANHQRFQTGDGGVTWTRSEKP